MFNKKAQGMPMNVIIIAIIVLVVLVILIAFFAGGFGSIVGKVRDLFGGSAGQAKDLAIQTCTSLCESAGNLPSTNQKESGYCKQTFLVDDDANPETKPKRMSCAPSVNPELTADDGRRGITQTGSLNVDCSGIQC